MYYKANFPRCLIKQNMYTCEPCTVKRGFDIFFEKYQPMSASILYGVERFTTLVFSSFLTPVLTPFFYPKLLTTFLTCFNRSGRQKNARKKVLHNLVSNSQPPGHESNKLTTEPIGWHIAQD